MHGHEFYNDPYLTKNVFLDELERNLENDKTIRTIQFSGHFLFPVRLFLFNEAHVQILYATGFDLTDHKGLIS